MFYVNETVKWELSESLKFCIKHIKLTKTVLTDFKTILINFFVYYKKI